MKKDARLDLRQQRILEDYFRRSLEGDTMEQIAQDNGISRKTLSLYKNSEHGKQLYAEYMKELSIDDIPMFYQKLKEGVAKNSFKHMELFAKIHGMLAPNKQEIVTEDKTKPVNGRTMEEILADIKHRLGKVEEEEKADQERKKRIAEMEELSSRNVVNFYGKK